MIEFGCSDGHGQRNINYTAMFKCKIINKAKSLLNWIFLQRAFYVSVYKFESNRSVLTKSYRIFL
ncbi:hypothetical protein CJ483_03755 [Bacillus sp. PK3_68]|nr:hypothetical protein CJ483_03755 [Bacillus sp. PK3_68]